MTGGGVTETKFLPIEPCRLVDTRSGGGAFTNGTTRYFKVRGGGTVFADQGGKAGGCDIPSSGVSAVEVTISAVSPTGKGFLRAFPKTAPAATFLSYTGGTDIGNTGTVALCGSDGGLCLANRDLGVKNFSSTTDVVIDVNGYYTQPMAVVVNADATLSRGSRNTTIASVGAGKYTVKFNRNVSKCVYGVSVGNASAGNVQGYATATPRSGFVDTVYVQTFDAADDAADRGFHLTVTC